MTDSPAPTPPPVDLDAFRQTLEEGGIGEMLPVLLDAFLQDLPTRRQEVEQALAGTDLQVVARAAHALKSAAGTIHATHLHSLLGRLEQAGRNGAAGEVAAVGRLVRDEMLRVGEYLASVEVRG